MGGELFHAGGGTDRKTDMTKLIVTFCYLANAPKNVWQQKFTNCTAEALHIAGKRALITFQFLNLKLHQTAKIFANSDWYVKTVQTVVQGHGILPTAGNHRTQTLPSKLT